MEDMDWRLRGAWMVAAGSPYAAAALVAGLPWSRVRGLVAS